MSKWFPDVDDPEGLSKARNAGVIGAIAFATMICVGMGLLLFMGRMPVSGDHPTGVEFPLGGMIVELVLVAIAAWRFRIGKGLVWGSFILFTFVLEIVGKVASGTTNIGWFFFYAAVGAGLINGIRAAWATKNLPADRDYAEVFE